MKALRGLACLSDLLRNSTGILRRKENRTSLEVQWVRLHTLPTQGAQVQSLVGELRSHMPSGIVKNRKKKSASILETKAKHFLHVRALERFWLHQMQTGAVWRDRKHQFIASFLERKCSIPRNSKEPLANGITPC